MIYSGKSLGLNLYKQAMQTLTYIVVRKYSHINKNIEYALHGRDSKQYDSTVNTVNQDS